MRDNQMTVKVASEHPTAASAKAPILASSTRMARESSNAQSAVHAAVRSIRGVVVDSLLGLLIVVGPLALAASLFHQHDDGWHYSAIVQIAAVLLLVTVYFKRRVLSVPLKAYFLISLWFVLSLQ